MKIKKVSRVYLTVEIEQPWTKKDSDWISKGRIKAEELKRLIRASNLDDLGTVDWQVEDPTVCSFCGYDWEEDEEGPVCCDKAQREHHGELA